MDDVSVMQQCPDFLSHEARPVVCFQDERRLIRCEEVPQSLGNLRGAPAGKCGPSNGESRS